MKKTLRQRTWAIYTRPYFLSKSGEAVVYTGIPKAGATSDMGESAGTDSAKLLKGVNEGKELTSTMPYETGGWVQWYKTGSFIKLKEKYKELSEKVGSQHIQVVEIIPIDTLVTPTA